jgi:hypothetical protein
MLKAAGWLGGAAALLGAEPWRVRSAEAALWRITLDLNKEQDRQKVRGQWRVASGLVPGEPNEGLVAGLEASPARLPDYDDSAWEVSNDIRENRSRGFTFAWWRITVELPEEVDGVPLAGAQVFFETTVDNNGEIWVDGYLPPGAGMVGHNAHQRVMISPSAVPGARHVIACLAANGPLAAPRGGVWLRYATLAFETPG